MRSRGVRELLSQRIPSERFRKRGEKKPQFKIYWEPITAAGITLKTSVEALLAMVARLLVESMTG